MIIKDIIDNDFVNYKKTSMFIAFPSCTFKCDKLNGCKVCQNAHLVHEPNIKVDINKICQRYLNNSLTEAVVCGGMEPLDSFSDLVTFIWTLRIIYLCNDDVVIYTGYNKDEIPDKLELLKKFDNIIVKFGRYLLNRSPKFDEILGVTLASDNQYAEKIS